MSLDESLFSYVLKDPTAFMQLQRAGITVDHFIEEDHQKIWNFLGRMKRQHGDLPSAEMLTTRYPQLELPRVRRSDLPMILDQMQKRLRYNQLLEAVEEAAELASSFDNVDDAVQVLQGRLTKISMASNGKAHLVDLFSREVTEEMVEEIEERRSGRVTGLPSGLNRFDATTGGLHRRRMVVVMGRTGKGKSWIDLLFVVSAVMSGAKVILYPLEMTLSETAFRLYTIFSQKMFGATKVLRNTDLSLGKVTTRKAVKFLNALEDKFPGQLYVADIGRITDQYTNDRIEAEVELHRPDMFWVDYLTLLKAPGTKRSEGYQLVQQLSAGIKGVASRHNCVGGCSAQVNREAVKGNIFLPRTEHISYGDSIGHDADQVLSINRKDDHLYYSLVKNRHGPEFGMTKVKIAFNEGIIEEVPGSLDGDGFDEEEPP